MSTDNIFSHRFSEHLEKRDCQGEYLSNKDGEYLVRYVYDDAWAEMRANLPVTILEEYGDIMKVQSGHSVFQVKASCVCPVELE